MTTLKCDGLWQRDSLYLWSDKEHNEKCHSVYPGTSIDTIIAYFFTSQFVTQIFMKSLNFHIRCIVQSLLTLVGRCARYSGVMYLSLMLGTLVTLFSVSSTVITAASCSSESHLTLASVPCIVALCSLLCPASNWAQSPVSLRHSPGTNRSGPVGLYSHGGLMRGHTVCDTGHVLPAASTRGYKSKLNVCDV